MHRVTWFIAHSKAIESFATSSKRQIDAARVCMARPRDSNRKPIGSRRFSSRSSRRFIVRVRLFRLRLRRPRRRRLQSYPQAAAANGATTTAGTNHNARSPAPRALVLLAANLKVWVGLNDYIPLSLFRGRRSFCARRRILRDICPTKQRWKLGRDRYPVLECSSW